MTSQKYIPCQNIRYHEEYEPAIKHITTHSYPLQLVPLGMLRSTYTKKKKKNGISLDPKPDNSPEKLCHNRICCPSNRSKQVQETHTAYIADTQYTRQSLNEKQYRPTWLHRPCHEWHVAEKVSKAW